LAEAASSGEVRPVAARPAWAEVPVEAPADKPVAEPARAPSGTSPEAAGLVAHWLTDLQRQARAMLEQGRPDVWDALSREFESALIETALAVTRGRRIEAAHKLGIGRNTITRKIQELRLDEA
jgi:two-component system nitrogen regulation response regulator GlnG